jgi:hypothetical protein
VRMLCTIVVTRSRSENRAGMCLPTEHHIGSRPARDRRLVYRARGYPQDRLATNLR